jgi:hypothetical protein
MATGESGLLFTSIEPAGATFFLDGTVLPKIKITPTSDTAKPIVIHCGFFTIKKLRRQRYLKAIDKRDNKSGSFTG